MSTNEVTSAGVHDSEEPTPDQIYLAERLGLHRSSLKALNEDYGVLRVVTALRLAWGFGQQIRNPYLYVAALLARGEA